MFFKFSKEPFSPAIEPRLQEPSFHSPAFAALPLADLRWFRDIARHATMDAQTAVTRGHNLSLLQSMPTQYGQAVSRQAWEQHAPRFAFSPTKPTRRNR